MATTKIIGGGTNTQIRANTITDTEINSSANIATSKLADGADFIKRTGTVAFTADQSMGSHKLTNVTDPTNPQDAATKNYVDSVAQGLDVHASVRLATAAVLSGSGPATYIGSPTFTLTEAGNGALSVDGVTANNGDRILVKDEATTTNNGIYVVTDKGSAGTPYILTRADDANSSAELVEGVFVFVEEGTANTASGWIQTQPAPVLDTDPIVWTQMSAAASFTAGNGIDISGSVISVKLNGANDYPNSGLNNGGSGLKLADLTDSHILVGNGSNRPADVALSGDASLANTGAITIPFKSAWYVARETPSGTINGSNVTFTLANTPVAGTESVFLNGLLQAAGGGADYTIATATITFNVAPIAGDVILVSYFK